MDNKSFSSGLKMTGTNPQDFIMLVEFSALCLKDQSDLKGVALLQSVFMKLKEQLKFDTNGIEQYYTYRSIHLGNGTITPELESAIPEAFIAILKDTGLEMLFNN